MATDPPPIPKILQEPSPFERERAARASDQPRSSRGAIVRNAGEIGRVWAIGIDFGASVLAGVVIGLAFDWLLGTSPWGLLCWTVGGLAGGFVRFVRSALRENKKQAHALKQRGLKPLPDGEPPDDL